MRSLTWSLQGESFKVDLPKIGGTDLFYEMVYCYFLSAKKQKVIRSQLLSEPLLRLVEKYLKINGIEPMVTGQVGIENEFKRLVTLDPSKHVVFLTSGKDSVHLLKTLVDRHGPDKILCIYVDRINKSEAIYEAKAAKKISEHFGVEFKMIEVVNSIKLTRDGHNIGLRDQLVLCCALPYILEFKAKNVWYGVTHDVQPAVLWTETKEAHSFVLAAIEKLYQCQLEVHFHCENGVHEFDIIKEIIQDRELLSKTSSCYTQQNFREARHAQMASKYPFFNSYHGCGSCIKCLRINGGILAFGEFDPEYAFAWLEKTKGLTDETILKLRPLVADKFKRK